MAKTEEERLKAYLKKHEVITTKEAGRLGIGRNTLSLFVKSGKLKRLERGVYATSVDILFDPLGSFVPAVIKVPEGVVCLISALKLYELTDEMAEEKWIAIPHAKKVKPFSNVRFIRLRGLNYKLGMTVKKYKNYEIRIYNREKTIIDCFKYLPRELALKALREYLKQKDQNIDKLISYGRKLKSDISDTITTLVTI